VPVQNERGRKWAQLKSLRNFLRISLRSSAYSSTIRRASSVREGLLGLSCGSSSCCFRNGASLTLAHRQQFYGTPLFVIDLDQGMSVQSQRRNSERVTVRSGSPADQAGLWQAVPQSRVPRPDTSPNRPIFVSHRASARNHGVCPPHAAAAEWIIGIQHNSGARLGVCAIDNVMLLLHTGVVLIFDI
jgi:hypothetical protein